MTSSEQPRSATQAEILEWAEAEDLATSMRQVVPDQAEAEELAVVAIDRRRAKVATKIRDTLLARKAENVQDRERLAEEARVIRRLTDPAGTETKTDAVDLKKGVVSKDELLAYVKARGEAPSLTGRAWSGLGRNPDALNLFASVNTAEEGARPQMEPLLNIESLEGALLTSPESIRGGGNIGDKTMRVLEDLVVDYRIATATELAEPISATAGA
jgi:hypothetical protein